MTESPGVSILVMTRNEEQNIAACLSSVSWSDDIHVLDSLSTDDTVRIAESLGARVTSRAFDNWAAHQNWALENLRFAHPWVFNVDADERVSPELAASIQAASGGPGENVAFICRRRDFFMGTPMKHAMASPFNMRLYRPEKMGFERLVNPVPVPEGPVGFIAGYLDHYPFSRGLTYWIERHNSYSTLEALEIERSRADGVRPDLWKALTCRDFHERRYHQKQIFYRLPLRPFWKFIILYVGRGGFLDGRAGFTYAVLQSIYEYLIVLKTRELRRGRSA